MPNKNNISFLEVEYYIGDYVEIKATKVKAIIVGKTTTGYDIMNKYKYTAIDNHYNKKILFADQMIKLSKTTDKYKDNVVEFKRKDK